MRPWCIAPFVAMAFIACGGQRRPHITQSAARGGWGGAVTANNAACPEVAGTWLVGQSDCAGGDLLIAQDGCNVTVSWSDSYSGTVSTNALTFTGASDTPLLCTAALSGNSMSGGCTGATPDGDTYDCTFDAILEGP